VNFESGVEMKQSLASEEAILQKGLESIGKALEVIGGFQGRKGSERASLVAQGFMGWGSQEGPAADQAASPYEQEDRSEIAARVPVHTSILDLKSGNR
jgi:hypothetical protein